jgi:hypothetical protein
MNKKIFTLLASVLMLFLTAFTVNATISGGQRAVGDTVRTLPEGKGRGMYHIRIDSIYVKTSGFSGWVAASYEDKTPSTPDSTSTIIKDDDDTSLPSGLQNQRQANDTIVLGVNDGGRVVPISMNALRLRGSDNKYEYRDLQATMWCINIEDAANYGQMPTFHFTNKAFGLDLDNIKAYGSGAVYVQGTEGEGWMYSYSYDNGQLNHSRPFYRLTEKGGTEYTILIYRKDSIIAERRPISHFTADTIPGLLKFSIVEVAPVVLDADAFNTRMGEGGTGELAFDLPAGTTTYPNFFAEKLTAADDPEYSEYHYLNLKVNATKNVIYNVADLDSVKPTLLNGRPVVDGRRYINELGETYIRIHADGNYDEDRDNNKYRFIYFPSKDSLVINAFAVSHLGNNYIADGIYVDTVAYNHHSYNTASYYRRDGLDTLHYYGLYTETILDQLIVRRQDLFMQDNLSVITIGKEPANTRISFGINNCDMEHDGWQPPVGVYTIWDSRGRCLGIRIYNGSLIPQWMELEEGECPDRIPSYQWVVVPLSMEGGDPQSKRVHIYNREFGDLVNSEYVKIENILITKEPSRIFENAQSFFTYRPLQEEQINRIEAVKYGVVAGEILPVLDQEVCGISSASSGFRPVTKEYVEDPYLGYKFFHVNTDEDHVSFGKSEDIGDAKGMDYNAFAFNYYHAYDDTKYIDLKENWGESILHVNNKGGREAFQFRLGTNLRLASNRKFKPEVYGYPDGKYGEGIPFSVPDGRGGSFTQYVPRLQRYFYELKVADFYEYRDDLAEQYVVLKGANGNGSDIPNKLNYGVADVFAAGEPFALANVYLRETYFLPKEKTLNEERKPQDPSRRVYYAVLDRIPSGQHDRLGEMGLQVSDEIKGQDGSSTFNLVGWRVHETEDGIIKAQGKTVSSARVSTFALENVNYPLYRRLNSKKDDGATTENDGSEYPLDAPKTLRIYTQYNNREYLFEDALSSDADNMGINFLGFANADQSKEGVPAADGFIKYNYHLFIDTAYINRGTGPIKPQYLIAVDVKQVGSRVVNGTDGCGEPTKVTIPAYIRGRYLINATDSAREIGSNGQNGAPVRDKRYIAYGSWDRLAFVDAIHVDDRLYIVSELQKRGVPESYLIEKDGEIYVDGDELRRLTDEPGYARDPLNSSAYGVYYDFGDWNNYHNDVSFSLRFVKPSAQNAGVETGEGGTDNDTKQFLIESETTNRQPYGNRKIAPVQGGWVKIDNGVPVLSRSAYEDAINQAEIYNVELPLEGGVATANEAVTSKTKVVSGIDELSILNADGKDVTITNILGQQIIARKLNGDNVTLKVPKGIVVVTVDGDSIKAIVK